LRKGFFWEELEKGKIGGRKAEIFKSEWKNELS
jgi:hypothetical protein